MSLSTDSIFVEALQSNAELMNSVGDRVYGTAIPLPDEDLDNAPVPYVIVTFDGLTNDAGTKDDLYESNYDVVNIGISVVGETLEGLHELTQTVRDTILSYFRANQTAVEEYTFTADAIQYEPMKPCYCQVLHYQCDVYNIEDDEQD